MEVFAMKLTKPFLACFFLFSLFLFPLFIHSTDSPYPHHNLSVSLDPEKSFLHVIDTVSFPSSMLDKQNKLHFLLHGNLSIKSVGDGLKLQIEKGDLKSAFAGINTSEFDIKKKIPINHYSIQFPSPSMKTTLSFTITYEGTINHAIEQIGAEYARGFSETPGIISKEGIYLAGSTFWIPWFNDELITFTMNTMLPQSWDSVSQGKRTAQVLSGEKQSTSWDCREPMDEVYLIGAKFKEYILSVGNIDVMAFLREPDDNLANKYLETTGQYLEMYEKLIGKFPYSKFALIENFWETGYGMPSFTLLGQKVIRFPFILHSSYPHELLHNWWGNSVFVDYNSGNWCEGLTTYLADHLIKEQRGEGEDYRKTTLQDYTHYAAGKKQEFALSKFKARYDSLSSSIGYGKSLMVYHTLRLQTGDAMFKKIIQDFYKTNIYKHATFTDFENSVNKITGKNFHDFFTQWITRPGAPEIRIVKTSVAPKKNKYLVYFTLEQIQSSQPYTLHIPVAVSLEGQKEAAISTVTMTQKTQDFQLWFDKQPLFIDIDPQFDVFRKLHTNEIPSTLSNALGSPKILILLPSAAPETMRNAYAELAKTWAKESEGKMEIKNDTELKSLPFDCAIWLLGKENRFNSVIQKGLIPYECNFNSSEITIEKQTFSFDKASIVASVKNPKNSEHVIVLLSADRASALPGLGRKIPHYGKYSYLAFEGDEPTNILKGQWPLVGSLLSASLISPTNPAPSTGLTRGILPKHEPLERLAPLFSSARMMEHVKVLASEELEGRGLGSQGLEKAAQYIADQFKSAGLKPGGDDGTFFQTWQITGGPENKLITLRNVIAVIPGTKPEWQDQSVIICAHYDHLGKGWPVVHQGNEGKIHFGADDNASGVSVMLELAQTLGNSLKPERSIIFIAFTGEESKLLGSGYYIKNLETTNKNRLKKIIGIINLDTVGRLTLDKKLMVIGGNSAREWPFIFMGIGYTTGIQTQLIPQDLDASDHVNFIRAGIPGIQLFSGPHEDYHRPTDTPDKIDPTGLVKVASVTREAILYLSERKEPLTFTGAQTQSQGVKPASPTDNRRVGTGIMPDFAFAGSGVKIGAVSPGSSAEKAGLLKDDIIIKLADKSVSNLKEYSEILKTFKPGDTVSLGYIRQEKEYTVSIQLTAR